MHVEFLVEDLSSAAAVEVLLTRLLEETPGGEQHSWRIHPFDGKQRLLKNLHSVLRGIVDSDFADSIVVLVDADKDDCRDLKRRLLEIALSGHLRQRKTSREPDIWIRIAVTELEAWFIGDPVAARSAYPGITAGDSRQRQWRDPDGLTDAWEWLERLLIRRGHYVSRMPKTIVARDIASYLNLDPDHNTSQSFRLFLRTLREVYGLPTGTPSSRSPST